MTEPILSILAEASLRAGALALAVAAGLAVLRRRDAGASHAAWTSVLCGMLLMPVLPGVLPSIGIPVLGPAVAGERSPLAEARAAPPVPVPPATLAVHTPTAPGLPLGRRAPAALREAARPLGLAKLVTIGYLIVTGLSLLRLLFGWRLARRVLRGALPWDHTSGSMARAEVRESPEVAVPVTIGVWRPTILLPTAWRTWPRETLQAVLAHEGAHVERRDTLVAALARLNRSLFWFHPLAWWLERRLATAAEEVCDAVAARAIGDPRRYAQLLVEMADRVRASGGRLRPQGVGIDGSRLLGWRIDRVLEAAGLERPSRGRVGMTVTACVATIVVAAACQLSTRPEAAPEPRQVVERSELSSLGEWEVASLEAGLRARPEDLESRRRLLVHYTAVLSDPQATEEERAARRAHALWVIEHRPEAPLAGSHEARLWPASSRPGITGPPDDEGYAAARDRWLSHVVDPDVADEVLVNASRFFETSDMPLAERLLLRGRERDPDGAWSRHIGRLYAIALVGDWWRPEDTEITFVTPPEAEGAFATSVRGALAETSDVTLLLTVAERILRAPYPIPHRTASGVEYRYPSGPFELARPYVERAARLEPDSLSARVHLEELRDRRRTYGPLWVLRKAPLVQLYATAAALPDQERLDLFPGLAHDELWRGLGAERARDPYADEYVALALGNARQLAEDVLDLAPRFRSHPRHGSAVHSAHLTLAALALHDDDVQMAARELRRATESSPDEGLAYAPDLLAESVLRQLLEAGSREPVIAYLDWYAEVNVARRDEVLAAAAALRRGQSPELRWPSTDLWVTKDFPV